METRGVLWGGEAGKTAEILGVQLFTPLSSGHHRPGQRVRAAATGTTEATLSAWSCAKWFKGITLLNPCSRYKRRTILQTQKQVQKTAS